MTTDIIFDALERFIKSPSRLDWRDYSGDVAAYRAEQRSISKDRREALAALTEARAITPQRYEVMIASFPAAFSGRLTWDGAKLGYCTGQYYPTEYRKAARSVLWSRRSASKLIATGFSVTITRPSNVQ